MVNPNQNDPAPTSPPADAGPAVWTDSRPPVPPGREIPDTIIAMPFRVERTILLPAQLLALNTNPIQLIPLVTFSPGSPQGTPGPGLYYSVKFMHFRLSFNTTPYAGGSPFIVYLGPPANNVQLSLDLAPFITATQSIMHTELFSQIEVNFPQNKMENQPVILSAGSPITGGDGTMIIITEYTVLQL